MPLKVLVIDDQPDIRSLIRMTLEFEDMDVIEADNGKRGLELARLKHPDLILMDVMMPGDSGLTISKIIANDASLKGIPVVLLSAMGRQTDVDAGMASGAKAYLVKPFSPMGLVTLVQRLVGGCSPNEAAACGDCGASTLACALPRRVA
jgi:CheY-like chemotaxis protein